MSLKSNLTDIDINNLEFRKALQIINFSNRSLFLTGKAGTGKSTFLRYICANTKKKYVVLAPTGIAAINCNGSTLHSFFKLPFYPILPNDSRYSYRHIRETLKYNGEKCKILRELDLIIIDEISMVRADIIDLIDKILRVYTRNMRVPFGGKQLLLVGDIYQLEPVVKSDDRQLLRPFYQTFYFFGANVFREIRLVCIELLKVYRQTDETFIKILDRIRNNSIVTDDLSLINGRVVKSGTQTSNGSDIVITLSTRRDTVDYINTQKLASLPGEAKIVLGETKGEFPQNSLPTPIELELKIGAQIIFVKNDIDKRWVNGTLGIVEAINETEGYVSVITEDGQELDVGRESWSNIRYNYNEKEQKIEEEEIGVYMQVPIRLAWAITVHKSQGLTFKKVNIDLSGGAFAAGQTYVALSRCTSLEGISLKEPIKRSDIFVNSDVVNFTKSYNDSGLIEKVISEAKADVEYFNAVKAFDNCEFDDFLDSFFKAIHSRYDIEKPLIRRYIRKKLHIISMQRNKIQKLENELAVKDKFLKKLAVEYVIMGRECEKEQMPAAAIANYKKALELCPDIPEAKRRLLNLGRDRN